MSTFTVEGWIYPTNFSSILRVIGDLEIAGTFKLVLCVSVATDAKLILEWFDGASKEAKSTGTLNANAWNWFAVVVNSNSINIYVNSTTSGQTGTTTLTGRSQTSNWAIGRFANQTKPAAYFSNLRWSSGIARTISSIPTAPYSSDADTTLLTCQSNRFVDNSGTPKTITVAGTPSVTPFSPFAPSAAYSASTNGGSGYFDGTGDYLSIADAAGLRFGTGNFTIQAWIYRSVAGAVHSIAAKGGASTGWVFQVHSDNKLRFTQTTTNIDSTGTIPAGTWTHVAVVREGTGTNQTKLYINGVNDGQATVTTDFNQTEQLNIGADRGNANPMNGYIAGFKYVVGTAETITVPTAPPTGGTALLNFTNAGIFDNTGKNNLETVANAQIDTTIKKFGTGSIEFDGTDDYLVTNGDSNNFAFGSGNFTIEFWLYLDTVSGTQNIYDGRPFGSVNATTPSIYMSGSSIRYFVSSADRITGGNLSTGVWYHIALARSGTSTKLFIDGSQSGSTYTDSTVYTSASNRPVIGADSNALNTGFLNGFIDDLRITKGVARYTANFTAPTKAFPDQ
jgi:hypothetical protein